MLVEIPGYREAVEAEQRARELAFLPIAEPICGIEQVPFTMRHFFFLELINSPFVLGGVAEPEDCAMFLWICSPGFKASDDLMTRWRRFWFIRRCRKIPYLECVKSISDRIDTAFQDQPSSRGTTAAPMAVATMAAVVHTIANQYGWTTETVLSTPVAQLMQYYRLIQISRDPSMPVINRSERVKQKWLEERRKARQSPNQN